MTLEISKSCKYSEELPAVRRIFAIAALHHNYVWLPMQRQPRIRRTQDEKWTRAHDGAATVDLAASEFGELPADAQAKSMAVVHRVLRLVELAIGLGFDPSLADMDEGGVYVHDAWLAENPAARTGDLGVSYRSLPPDQQRLDSELFRIVVAFCAVGDAGALAFG